MKKYEISEETIRRFVFSNNRFSFIYEAIREHLRYCSRCRILFQKIAQENGFDPDVDRAIYYSFQATSTILK